MTEKAPSNIEEIEGSVEAEPDYEGSLVAAIDLGSNSFHLLVARIEHGEVRPVETLAEKVQLGAGLEDNLLSPEAIERGLECLGRFAQLLDSIGPAQTRVVGTHALRIARNRHAFTIPARHILGTRVDVVYGREEARLVYLGVAHALADDAQSRLVIDIGGGSTELIIGERFEPRHLESLQMGCVSYGKACFPAGVITRDNYYLAYDMARERAAQIRHLFHSRNWAECVGSSGTLQAIDGILTLNTWSEGGITRQGLRELEQRLLAFDNMDAIDIDGLATARRNVILPGVAITSALFDLLNIKHMRTSKGALREGVIYDLIGRLGHEDVRERTINALMQRYSVDTDIADIVEGRARMLYRATRVGWQLGHNEWELLHWAARTHEIGMAIAHKNFNRHSAYVLRNADLPGFSQEEQEQLAVLSQGHRGKLTEGLFTDIPESEQPRLHRVLTLLRLATSLKYVETLEQLPEFKIQARDNSLSLEFPGGWLDEHPLTTKELAAEQSMLARLGIELAIS